MGCTALHNAADWGNFDVYDYLVSQGASEDIVNEFGYTPKQRRKEYEENPKKRDSLSLSNLLRSCQIKKRADRKTQLKGGGKRKRWKDKKGNIYEWDYQHGTVEKYDKRGKHKGEFDAKTGQELKLPNPKRRVEP